MTVATKALMYDRKTFIRKAPDCAAERGVIPESNREPRPIHVLQYELLSANPYRFTREELLCEVEFLRSGAEKRERERWIPQILHRVRRKPQPCLCTSTLGKKYGWGIHLDDEGKVAIYGCETEEYRRLANDEQLAQTTAMGSGRG